MRYICQVCGYTYDPMQGDPSQNIPPGVPFEALPASWVCPVCGASRSLFEPESALEEGEERPAVSGRVVIVGNGVAGFTVARELARRSSGLEIHVLAEEPHHYYARPQLPRLLSGELEVKDLVFYDETWYERRGIRVHLSDPAVAIDRLGRGVSLRSGGTLGYDWLVLACGSRPAVPPIPGAGKDGVFTLRTIEDALEIRQRARNAEQVVILGGGLLGLEAARGFRKLGLAVTVVEIAPYLLPRQLDGAGGEILRQLLEQQGIRFVLGIPVAEFVGERSVKGVRLADARTLETELVLLSAGIQPEVELARASGLACERGILVDDHLRTEDPRIYACGDAAQHRGRIYGIIPPAIEQALVVSNNVLGREAMYAGSVPVATLKVAGIDLTSVGEVHAEGSDVEHVRASRPEEGRYRMIVLRNGRAIGAALLGLRQEVPRVLQLVAQQANLGPVRKQLEDPDFRLDEWG
ncbi:MAG: FAD-dependent oxidoreductase [candidate division KSB1 bacterium]|nr:FAD-dependent oxidoreductase [candidate division KSB1 bacterium]